MISVVIPLYNKEKQIAKTLQTVLNQTYQNFEIVIVNDGSTDRSVDEVKKFLNSRIRLINQKNGGVSAARNRGIKEAKGEYLAFLDADDIWQNNYLQTQIDLICKYPFCGVWATDYLYRRPSGKEVNTIINNLKFEGEDGLVDNYFSVASTSSPPLWTSAIVLRKSIIQQIGGFPVGLPLGEDLLTWAKMALCSQIAYSKKALAVYCIRDTHSFDQRPMKRISKEDPVGVELQKIYSQNKTVEGLRCYLSSWHKMRAFDAMRNCQRLLAWNESFKALKYNLKNFKIYAIIFLSVLPESLMHLCLKLKK